MVEMKILTRHDDPDLIDFINYVFSMDGDPTDFVKLLPKAYEPETGHDILHLTLQEEGKIVAAVSLLFETYRRGADTLRIGFVGNVSTHPYRRGRGYMKWLMGEADRVMEERGCDIAVLSGQRQRYEYFGYAQAGLQTCFVVTKDNLRHGLGKEHGGIFLQDPEGEPDTLYEIYRQQSVICRDRKSFYQDCRSWQGEPTAVCRRGEPIGYVVADPDHKNWLEAVMPAQDYPGALASFMEAYGVEEVRVRKPLYETEILRILEAISEEQHVEKSLMIKVFHWEAFLTYCLRLKPQKRGCWRLGPYRVTIQGESVKVEKRGEEELSADRLFSLFPREEDPEFLPLLFWMSEQDTF